MTGATYRKLDELISSWAEKYAVDDIHEIETSLSTEQKESIIAALEGYCAQLSWKTFTDELPKLAYRNLPKLFAHAMISKTLPQKILCHPFYYLDDQYASNVPLFASKTPPAGTALFLKFLLRDMILTRRDGALECRKLMLWCLHAPNFRSRNEPRQPAYHMRFRKNAQRIIIDILLGDFDLRALLKTKQPTDNERKDMDRIYSMADELCIRMNMTTKDMQFRYWETLPLYDSHFRIMELAPVSKTADRERKRVEKHSGTKTKKAGNRSSPTINRRFVVLTLRPAFSYFKIQPYHWKRPRRDEDESIICRASVVLTKTEAPLEGGVFSNLPTEIRAEFDEKCRPFMVYYDKPLEAHESGIVEVLGHRSEWPGDGPCAY
ncbi:hypothetical protein BJX62DRAFT_234170 [Aspergillus germanicus]